MSCLQAAISPVGPPETMPIGPVTPVSVASRFSENPSAVGCVADLERDRGRIVDMHEGGDRCDAGGGEAKDVAEHVDNRIGRSEIDMHHAVLGPGGAGVHANAEASCCR